MAWAEELTCAIAELRDFVRATVEAWPAGSWRAGSACRVAVTTLEGEAIVVHADRLDGVRCARPPRRPIAFPALLSGAAASTDHSGATSDGETDLSHGGEAALEVRAGSLHELLMQISPRYGAAFLARVAQRLADAAAAEDRDDADS